MTLDEGTLRLIAVGASVSANCLPCLEHNINRARASGLAAGEISDAIEVGQMVRKGAATKMDELVARLDKPTSVAAPVTSTACCGS